MSAAGTPSRLLPRLLQSSNVTVGLVTCRRVYSSPTKAGTLTSLAGPDESALCSQFISAQLAAALVSHFALFSLSFFFSSHAGTQHGMTLSPRLH